MKLGPTLSKIKDKITADEIRLLEHQPINSGKQKTHFNLNLIIICLLFTDAKKIAILNALSAILKPTGFCFNKNNNKKWKYSIYDSQRAFIRKIETANDWALQIKNIKDTYAAHNTTLQPFILNINNSKFCCVYENIIYTFDDILQALAVSFKLHFVFNLQYQIECKLIWELIQIYFFDIPIDTPKQPQLTTLLFKLQ